MALYWAMISQAYPKIYFLIEKDNPFSPFLMQDNGGILIQGKKQIPSISTLKPWSSHGGVVTLFGLIAEYAIGNLAGDFAQ